jgi:hypothetical protein
VHLFRFKIDERDWDIVATKVPTSGELIYRVTGDVVMSKIMSGEIPPVESISHELISQYTHEPTVIISTFEHARGLTDDIKKITWTVTSSLIEDRHKRGLITSPTFAKFKAGEVNAETTELTEKTTKEVMFILYKYMEHSTNWT